MSTIDDETLMAYADREVDDETAAAVERRIADDPEARRKVEIFMEAGALARRALAAPVREPVPDRLVRAVLETSLSDRADEAPHGAPRTPGWLLGWLGELARPAIPVAASIMLLIGVGGGYLLGGIDGQDPPEDGLLPAAGLDRARLSGALETAESGRPVTWRSARGEATVQLLVRATFRNKQGEFCREYEEDLKQARQTYHFFGIACRTGKSTWETRVVAAAPPAEASSDPNFRPAGNTGLDVIETALDVMIEGRPFSKELEAQALTKGWSAD